MKSCVSRLSNEVTVFRFFVNYAAFGRCVCTCVVDLAGGHACLDISDEAELRHFLEGSEHGLQPAW